MIQNFELASMRLNIQIFLVPSGSNITRKDDIRLSINSNKSMNSTLEHAGVAMLNNVSVGIGNSSIKWLALMASYQFSCKYRGERERLLPNNVYTNDESFLHPDHFMIG